MSRKHKKLATPLQTLNLIEAVKMETPKKKKKQKAKYTIHLDFRRRKKSEPSNHDRVIRERARVQGMTVKEYKEKYERKEAS